ncbi:hypothetical protein [Caudoviricetes sp.]|nr:hypothetical protein [Caudoviricetes sp.]
MTMKKWEGSKADKAMDKRLKVKEGSKADMKADKAAVKRANAKKK